jgi:hypothetical protein
MTFCSSFVNISKIDYDSEKKPFCGTYLNILNSSANNTIKNITLNYSGGTISHQSVYLNQGQNLQILNGSFGMGSGTITFFFIAVGTPTRSLLVKDLLDPTNNYCITLSGQSSQTFSFNFGCGEWEIELVDTAC